MHVLEQNLSPQCPKEIHGLNKGVCCKQRTAPGQAAQPGQRALTGGRARRLLRRAQRAHGPHTPPLNTGAGTGAAGPHTCAPYRRARLIEGAEGGCLHRSACEVTCSKQHKSQCLFAPRFLKRFPGHATAGLGAALSSPLNLPLETAAPPGTPPVAPAMFQSKLI